MQGKASRSCCARASCKYILLAQRHRTTCTTVVAVAAEAVNVAYAPRSPVVTTAGSTQQAAHHDQPCPPAGSMTQVKMGCPAAHARTQRISSGTGTDLVAN